MTFSMYYCNIPFINGEQKADDFILIGFVLSLLLVSNTFPYGAAL